MQQQAFHHDTDGFTLVEAVVAILVLTTAFAGSMALMTTMLRANSFSTRMTRAVSLAQDVIDDLAEERYSAITEGSDSVDDYERTWSVATAGSTKQLEVTVSWQSIDNENREFVTSTIIDDRVQ